MLQNQTLSLMNTLKLHGMALNWDRRLQSVLSAELPHADFVALLLQDEKTHRDNRRQARLLKKAGLRQNASLEDVNHHHPRGFDKRLWVELANPVWISAGRNLLFTGPTGIGKSWLACALGNFAARQGFSVFYQRAPRLFETLLASRGDGSHLRLLDRLAKIQFLIIDDLFVNTLGDLERRDLLEIIEARHQSVATVVTSQLPTSHWHAAIGDPTIADAVCDRFLHNAYKLEFTGDSIRKKQAEDKSISTLVGTQTQGG